MSKRKKQRQLIGWREWASLPLLNIENIKAKIDTGARTSTLHAVKIKRINNEDVSFIVHPLQGNEKIEIACMAKIVDSRDVKSSSGHVQHRYVVKTELHIGTFSQTIELTLSNRSDMGFRLLLGRQALRGLFLVDAAKSFLISEPGR